MKIYFYYLELKYNFIHFEIWQQLILMVLVYLWLIYFVTTLNTNYSSKIIQITLFTWVINPVQQVRDINNNSTKSCLNSWNLSDKPNRTIFLFLPWNIKMPPNTSLKIFNNHWLSSLKSFFYVQSMI